MTEKYLPSILRTRWDDAVANPSIMNFEAVIGLAEAFIHDITRHEPSNILIPSLNGVIADCKARIKNLMPEEPTC